MFTSRVQSKLVDQDGTLYVRLLMKKSTVTEIVKVLGMVKVDVEDYSDTMVYAHMTEEEVRKCAAAGVGGFSINKYGVYVTESTRTINGGGHLNYHIVSR